MQHEDALLVEINAHIMLFIHSFASLSDLSAESQWKALRARGIYQS